MLHDLKDSSKKLEQSSLCEKQQLKRMITQVHATEYYNGMVRTTLLTGRLGQHINTYIE